MPKEIFHPPKSTLRTSIINPNTRASQYYNILEDFPQAPCVMSALELLQTCPNQRKSLLTALGSMDPENSNIIAFKLDDFNIKLSHQLDFHITTKIVGNNIHHTFLHEEDSTSVMSFSCWRATGSPEINCSPTTLKAFDGRGFKLYGILPSL